MNIQRLSSAVILVGLAACDPQRAVNPALLEMPWKAGENRDERAALLKDAVVTLETNCVRARTQHTMHSLIFRPGYILKSGERGQMEIFAPDGTSWVRLGAATDIGGGEVTGRAVKGSTRCPGPYWLVSTQAPLPATRKSKPPPYTPG